METNKTIRTRNKIIEVARELFATSNFYKTTMDAIAKSASMSRRTLYMHFKSKEDILMYVVEDEAQRIIKKLQSIGNSTMSPDRKLRLHILTRFNAIDSLIRRNRYVRYDFIFNQLKIEQRRKPIDIIEEQILHEIIKEGKEKGIFYCSSTEDFASTILRMLKSLEQPFVHRNNRVRTYNMLKEYVDMLFNGILNQTK
ncbi:MAG: TetR/AcrR family transcriptional regulator [Marinifilaceae bacterium]|nr:TetR/AcrR family transcriptional regulator [Marinifilaceae bacterium]